MARAMLYAIRPISTAVAAAPNGTPCPRTATTSDAATSTTRTVASVPSTARRCGMWEAWRPCHGAGGLIQPRFSMGTSGRDPSLARPVGPEPVDRRRAIGLPGLEHDRRELGMVDRIGEVLRLEAERGMLVVRHALAVLQAPVQEVPRVELDRPAPSSAPPSFARSSGSRTSPRAPAFRLPPSAPALRPSENEVVVVADGRRDRHLVDPRPIGVGDVKSKTVPFTGFSSPVGISAGVDRRVLIGRRASGRARGCRRCRRPPG